MENTEHIITSEEELRSLLGTPSELAASKVIDHLDDHCRTYIGQSPFLLMATSDASGACDVSPRGDAPGFVLLLDDKRLLIPERPGNRRVDSMRNILANPQVGLIFLIPGLEETLRVNGRAYITRDPELLQRAEVNGRLPLLGIGVEVQECFIHCAKALKRSRLWQPDTWPEKQSLPSAAQILAAHVNASPETVAAALHESYTKRMY